MNGELSIRPFVRVAHYYRFPIERNASESSRIGYCYAFHLVREGRGRISVPGESRTVKKGDLIFFPPSLRHSFYSDPAKPLATYNVYCELWADKPLRTDVHLVWNDADFHPAYLTSMRPNAGPDRLPLVQSLQHREALMTIFAEIVRHHQSEAAASEEIAASLLKAFVLELVQQARQPSYADRRIQAVIERIDREADARAREDQWLDMTGLRKSQFHQLFKQATGMPPKAYLTRAVMKRAAVSLTESGRSITDIASDLGYSSIHHFTRQFTQFYGTPPTEYRKRQNN